jgi:hypothetical protein
MSLTANEWMKAKAGDVHEGIVHCDAIDLVLMGGKVYQIEGETYVDLPTATFILVRDGEWMRIE